MLSDEIMDTITKLLKSERVRQALILDALEQDKSLLQLSSAPRDDDVSDLAIYQAISML